MPIKILQRGLILAVVVLLVLSSAGCGMDDLSFGGFGSGSDILDRDKTSPNENPSPGNPNVDSALSGSEQTLLVLVLFVVGGLMLGIAFIRARHLKRKR